MYKYLLPLLFFLPSSAFAELYVYKDKQGIVHYTNINPRKKKLSKTASNTFLHKGQKVHRAEVNRFDASIHKAAKHYSLPFALLKAVIAAESGFEPSAVSPKGAEGLMQLMPGTAQQMLVNNSFDPEQNIFGGSRYLRILANRFSGDLRQTLAGYNAGPEAVARFGGIPPYPETQLYVKRVLALYQYYLKPQQKEG